MGEPWCWPPSEVRLATMSMWYEVVNHPRDDKGKLERGPKGEYVPPGPSADPTSRAGFFRYWELQGSYPPTFVEAKWREYREMRRRMEADRPPPPPEGHRMGEVLANPEL